jgi:hypothetical protein
MQINSIIFGLWAAILPGESAWLAESLQRVQEELPFDIIQDWDAEEKI